MNVTMNVTVTAVDRPDIPALVMPARFRHDVMYFATPAGVQDAPTALPEREYWIRRADTAKALADFAVTIVSPLDSDSRTEIELTDDQERFLEWLQQHDVQHVRLS